VDVGQTVQASFSAPELFLIAGDLTRMQILVSVDESDIGQIAEGQTARFTVQAYPDDIFAGTVHQVRLQSSTEDNVVSYTAVVSVANPDGRLLPGMTATVEFLVETAADVLYVANASLRYRPDQEAMASALDRLQAEREPREADESAPERPTEDARAGEATNDRGLLWTVDAAGELSAIPVRTGISNGVHTAVSGHDLGAGMQVIAGASSNAAAASTVSSPFQQQQTATGPGPPIPGGF
jgi:HlyD family secretion protein